MYDNSHNEQALLGRVAQGDEHAFGIFFHSYNVKVFPFVLKITKSPAIAEEIVQEVFLRAWIHREKLPELEQPGAWLFRIASNLSLTHLRNTANESIKRHELGQRTEPFVNEVDSKLDSKELERLVEQAVSQLPPRRRDIYRLSRQEGLTHREIAEKLAISPNTVKDHLVIAARFIREHIRKETGLSLGILVLIRFL